MTLCLSEYDSRTSLPREDWVFRPGCSQSRNHALVLSNDSGTKADDLHVAKSSPGLWWR